MKRIRNNLGRHPSAPNAISEPQDATALYNRGNAFLGRQQPGEALTSYDAAIRLKPDHAGAFNNRGNALVELKRFDEALTSYDAAIRLRPDYADAYCNRGNLLLVSKRFDEALASYEAALALKPDYPLLPGLSAHIRGRTCLWRGLEDHIKKITQGLLSNQLVCFPFSILALVDDPAIHRHAAQLWGQERIRASGTLPALIKRPRGPKIHIAYLSADFSEHAMMHVMAELFELHDRSRFELTAISFGADDGSALRSRVAAAFDRFEDVKYASTADVARRCRELGVDIAVDLMGHTHTSRPGILAERCAPVQIQWLGYPGTMAAPFIDYIVADRTLITEADLGHYTEKVIWLPDSYQVNDRKRRISTQIFTRADCGLPESGFVFCCFNNPYKILPATFDVWMRILQRVPGSVLWLYQDNASVTNNLRAEAEARGIDPARLVFVRHMPLDTHLARHRVADLGLDTWPYNGHATSSHALWAGLPVLTRSGHSLASRVAASLLHAIGLPELITQTDHDYEELAVALAQQPARLQTLKDRLAANRLSHPLFDSPRFTRHLETAYQQVMERHWRGQEPEHIDLLAASQQPPAQQATQRTAPQSPGMLQVAIEAHQKGDLDRAQALYRSILEQEPNSADARHLLGLIATQRGNHAEALKLIDDAIALVSGNANFFFNRGHVLVALKQFAEALASYEAVLGLKADYPFVPGLIAHIRGKICRWRDLENLTQQITDGVRLGQPVSDPFPFLGLTDDPDLQRRVADRWCQEKIHPSGTLPARIQRQRGPKIHIAYLSADFREHAVSHVIAELFELHDRSRFELTAISFGADDGSALRSRVAAAFDRFEDVRYVSDLDVARRCRELGVDIAVDLKGYTQYSRPGIFAERCAPIQINWLGYPGTMAMPFIDYIVADHTLITEADLKHYSEKVIWLPDTYWVNDGKRRISAQVFTRADCGLPESGFVFCCFNNPFKILPATFDVWMRILQRVPGSVLWLNQDNASVAANLHAEAEARGIDPARLVFARRLPQLADHLARCRVADLCIDNWPFNAHTTASDALWAGVPLLTRSGRSFASRVAASLLRAIGLPELITQTDHDYEELAVALAQQPARLQTLKDRLAANRLSHPLFDCPRFTRHLETAYQQVMERHWRGQEPAHINLLNAATTQQPPQTPPELLQVAIEAHQRGDLDRAQPLYQSILRRDPKNATALHLLGVIATQRGNYAGALKLIGEAIAIAPGNAVFHCNHGNALLGLKRHDEALLSYDTAIRLRPDYADAFNNRGNALVEIKRHDEALDSYDTAIRLKPNHADAFNNRGNALLNLKRLAEALTCYDAAIGLKPNHADALHNRGNVLLGLNRFDEALTSYEAALSLKPDYEFLPGLAAHIRGKICRWHGLEDVLQKITDGVSSNHPMTSPWPLIALRDDPVLHRRAAEHWGKDKMHPSGAMPSRIKRQRGPKIHIAYLSSDFFEHATSQLMAELFETHDRSRFELTAISFGPDDGSAMRARVAAAFDRFEDVKYVSDLDVARRCRELGVDIAVDLKGYTQHSRPGILAERCAPIQINWLGYPGTMAVPFIDYIVADHTLITEADLEHYSEKVIWLPDTYQVNDRKRPIAKQIFTRADCGLPESGFVFCCFNNPYKILPEIFDVWVRILQRVPGSVLWLYEDNATASTNLRAEAEARGIDPARLVFAQRMPTALHLARHRVADLCIDNWPCNAHTTASDALWAGIPLLTRSGRSFASRVAASLLHAIGLPELITQNDHDYEELAVALAQQPVRLQALKDRLAANRLSYPLFDCPRFTRHLETAYQQAMERHWRGQEPAHINLRTATQQPATQQPSPTPSGALQVAIEAHQRGDLDRAQALYRSILEQEPNSADALHLLGVIASQQGNHAAALKLIDDAIALEPGNANFHCNRGNALLGLKQMDPALVSFDSAIRMRPNHANAFYNRGHVLVALRRFDEALASYDAAIRLKPNHAEAFNNRGNTLLKLGRFDEALASYDAAIRLKPNHADAFNHRGNALMDCGRFDEALTCFEAALRRKPDFPFLPGVAAHIRGWMCVWRDLEDIIKTITEGVAADQPVAASFPLLAWVDDPVLHRRAALHWWQKEVHPSGTLPARIQRQRGPKIHIAYLSADFREHATSHLMAELFELHDRSRFELTAISFGVADGSALRSRVGVAFDRFVDVRHISDLDVARRCRELGVDIAVDLKGYTQHSRPGILAERCAPIQINWLGYPGTMAAPFIDYIVADHTLITEADLEHYSEKVIWLPDTYQVNDRKRRIDGQSFSRADCGLPDSGFVFCCFNNPYKILPATFDVWMRILQRIPGSVLWLLEDNATASTNLRAEAQARGIDPARLVFAQRIPLDKHLSRHRLADLCIDNWPCNAHTTASDALWAGVPLLTRSGRSFASRVAASLLRAIGLPELITQTDHDYEELAVALAQQPGRLQTLKDRLAANRLSYPLFDCPRFTRHLETAYQQVMERHWLGQEPAHINLLTATQQTTRNAAALYNRGNTFLGLKQHSEALTCYDEAIRLKPDFADALNNRGNTLVELKRFDEALVSYDQVIGLKPDHTHALCNQGLTHLRLKRFESALASFDAALALKPDYPFLQGLATHIRCKIGQWQGLEGYTKTIVDGVSSNLHISVPYPLFALVDDPVIHQRAAQQWILSEIHPLGILPALIKRPRGPKIHIAYLSADFREHAMMHVMAELFELHDRSRFELTGISFGADDGSALRARVATALDRFEDVTYTSTADVARRCRELGVDIAVDLMGHTHTSRPGILAERCAPVQIQWLGYPGTMAAPFIDYIVADRTLITEADLGHYTEKVIWLPDTYQVNDRKRPIAKQIFTRADCGLPESGFVFCCFNNPYKILPATFDVWMRILQRVPGSVLWLYQDNASVTNNLRAEAEARGIDPARLVFAQRMLLGEHLARHRVADLGLDTWPYNGHATSSHALWAGLPVLTRSGRSFASRVAASLLHAIGLPELIAQTDHDYEELAVALAQQPGRLQTLKDRLATNRLSHPLFDSPRFTRHLETAYQQVMERHWRGQEPAHIDLLAASQQPPAQQATQRTAPQSPGMLQVAIEAHQRGDLDRAQTMYRSILEQEPNSADARHLLGVIASQQGNHAAALKLIDDAIALEPGNANFHCNRGNALLGLKQMDPALVSFDSAIRMRPNHANAFYNRGHVLVALRRFDEALASYDAAIRLKPNHAEALNIRGKVLLSLMRFDAALFSFDAAIRLKPDYIDAFNNRGNVLLALKRPEEAIASYDAVIRHDSKHATAYSNRGHALIALRRIDEALVSYDAALGLDPDFAFLQGLTAHVRSRICLWHGLEEMVQTIVEGIAADRPKSASFSLLALVDDPLIHRRAAQHWAKEHVSGTLPARIQRQRGPKIHIAYLSADFRDHAMMHVMAELFELHDRNRFELTAISFGPDDGSALRSRVAAAFDRFEDVQHISDTDVTRRCRELGVDIAVDLMGYTQQCRPGIVAGRCAPVQINWLGYPGTMAMPFIDYIVADHTLITESDLEHYSEKIIWLPDSYQVNDRKRPIAKQIFTRADCGLPESGFVFCCFNNPYKILPATFDVWMRILQRVPGSVLWLYQDNALVVNNLRAEAEARGIDPARLVFAQRIPLDTHLARHRVADLGLDTWPYNGHATSSHALWAGLPVLTRSGHSLASRVAASLLHAIGLPELITQTDHDYEELAVALAQQPARLQTLKDRLAANRLSHPLFDSPRFTRHLETAYQQVMERHWHGQEPAHINLRTATQQTLYRDAQGPESSRADSFNNRGTELTSLNRFDEALVYFDQAIGIQPDYTEAHYNRGYALMKIRQIDKAISSYDTAIRLRPGYTEAYINRGNAFLALKRPDQAIADYDAAIRCNPKYASAHCNRGAALMDINRPDQALTSFDVAIQLNPEYPMAFNNRGNALLRLNRFAEALTSYDAAIRLKPDYADAYNNRGTLLSELSRLDEALTSYETALEIKPDYPFLPGISAHIRSKLCQWHGLEVRIDKILEGLSADLPMTYSFPLLALADDPVAHRRAARHWAKAQPSGSLPTLIKRQRGPKIHIAYLSADFREHAMMHVMAELFELHDRSRFELTAISFGADDGSALRARVGAAFDRFEDVQRISDTDVARRCRELGVDIAVDLMGYTHTSRPGILAERCAPVQMQWLGYPGTMAAPFIDYIVADRTLITESDLEHYTEKVIWLPDSYQVNDRQRRISTQIFTRADCGLPESGFVFCCFNNPYKILPATFDVWMRILRRVPGSVLWLYQDNATAATNLRAEAEARGIDPSRLVFAHYMPLDKHLARHRVADLGLDNWPYNGHATASHSLWTGLPILTRSGRSLASRVTASLLNAIGLPDLITQNDHDYEELAVALAQQPARLQTLKDRLAANRLSHPLFDCPRFTRHLETAYQQVMERHWRGQEPAHINLRSDTQEHDPNKANALHLMGVTATQQGNHVHALKLIDEAIALEPGNANFHSNRGNVLVALKRPEEALVSFDEAIRLKPDYANAFNNRGNGLLALKRVDEAISSYDAVLRLDPKHPTAHCNRGAALMEINRPDMALASFDMAIQLNPGYALALNNRGNALVALNRLNEALTSYDTALELNPDYTFLPGLAIHIQGRICQWHGLENRIRKIIDGVRLGQPVSVPFSFLALTDDPDLQRRVADRWCQEKIHPSGTLPARIQRQRGPKIHIAYLSADFREHAVSHVIAELFELHDRSRFELTAFSFGPDDGSALRSRVAAAFDRFEDVRYVSDLDVARRCRELGVDIAVDLKGYTQYSRPGIFAERCAPIQINWLGYPGTMAMPFIDYIVADHTLITEADLKHYSEKVIWLPDTYWVNDGKRRISAQVFTRADCGLPESGFVFCCFNNPFKILPATFDVWMRILQRVPGSVLWLNQDNASVAANLHAEAEARGIDPARLVFARRLPQLADHLARCRVADLCIDNWPFNAHTTASDALWAGVPLLTRSGRSFTSRVAASLLHAIGLPELITQTDHDYEELAVALAQQPARLQTLKDRLAANRLSHPLFDCPRFTRHLETAYQQVMERHWRGQEPAHLKLESESVLDTGKVRDAAGVQTR